MLRPLIPIVVGFVTFSVALSCSSDNGAKKGGSKPSVATSTNTGKNKPKKPKVDDDDGGSDGDASGNCLTDSPDGLGLQDASIIAKVTAIVGPKCAIACHNSASAPGGGLTSAAELQANAASILDRINRAPGSAGIMPPSGKLSDDEIQTLEMALGAFAPSTSTSTSTSTSSSTSTDSGSDTDVTPSAGTGTGGAAPCSSAGGGSSSDDDAAGGDDTGNTGTGTGNTGVAAGAEAIKEAFAPYVNPEEKQSCHDQGLAFYRDQDETHPYGRCYDGAKWPASFECNRAGVLAAFKDNAQVKTYLDEKEAKGWYYDDCGVLNGKPVVFFACYSAGGDSCVKIDDISPSALTIKGEVLRIGG